MERTPMQPSLKQPPQKTLRPQESEGPAGATGATGATAPTDHFQPPTLTEPAALCFPEIAWRGLFDEYRAAMYSTTEASDVAHFATFWAAMAVKLGREIDMWAGRPLYPNVYLGYFGLTGDRKTTAQRRIFHCNLLGDAAIPIIQSAGWGFRPS